MKQILILMSLLGSLITNSQSFQWVAGHGGFDIEEPNSVAVDALGNVYTTGVFYNNGDYDPGPGVFMLNAVSPGVRDIFISKLDASGNFVWAKSIGGTNNEWGMSITVDPFGDIYITGTFLGTVDFDPGPGTFTLSAPNVNFTFGNVFVLKLDAGGNFIWARSLQYLGSSAVIAIEADAQGNTYTSGYFGTTIDFDPGPGVFTITPQSNDVFILKLNPAGNFIWARSFGGAGANISNVNGMTVDNRGAVYTTGIFKGTVDFDPGPMVGNLTANGNFDAFFSKLDSSGNLLIARNFGKTPSAIGTINTYGNAIGIDALRNIYVTGIFTGPTDFDPGPSSVTMPYNFGYDMFLSKFDSTGNFMWTRGISGNGDENPRSISVDPNGMSYITGYFTGTADFDPSASSFPLSSAGNYDIFISTLNGSGSLVWARNLGSASAAECGNSIITDPAGNIYVTGYFYATTDFDPGTGSYTLAPAPPAPSPNVTSDQFVLKLAPCLTQTGSINGPTIACSGANSIYSVTAVPGATAYIWTLPSGFSFTSSLNTLTTQVGSSAGNGIFYVTPVGACGNGVSSALAVSVAAAPMVIVNSGSICSGQSFTINASGANSFSFSGGSNVVSPSITTSYSVTGSNTTGCAGSNTAVCTVTLHALPQISVSASPPAICLGSTSTLTAGGASTYTWAGNVQSASLSVNPGSTSLYSVSGTSSAGCVSSAASLLTLTVYPLPQVLVNSSSSVVCKYESFTLTASGASTYSWTSGSTGSVVNSIALVTGTYLVSGWDNNGCQGDYTFTQQVEECAGIEQIWSLNGIRVYPNPAEGFLNVEADEDLTITVHNQLGQELIREKLVFGKNQLNLEAMAAGMYLLRIQNEGKEIHQTFIIR